jgi:hypothetical protein
MPSASFYNVLQRRILVFAAPIPVALREAYLLAIASELRGREPGPGIIFRIARELQPRFKTPPPVPRVPRGARKGGGIRELD